MRFYKLLLVVPMIAFGFAMDASAADKPCNLMTNPGVQEADEYLYTDSGRHRNEVAYVCGSKTRWDSGKNKYVEYGCQHSTKVIVTDKEPHYNGDDMYRELSVWWCDENSANTHWFRESSLDWVYKCSDSSRFGSNHPDSKPENEFYRTTDRVYYCRSGRKGNNYCVAAVNSDVCYKDLKEVVCKEAGGKWGNNQCDCGNYKKLEGEVCVVDPVAEANACERLNANWLGTGVCQCKEGYEWDEKGEKCINKSKCNDAAVVCNGNLVYLENIGNSSATGGSGTSSSTSEANVNSKNTNTTGGKSSGGKTGGGSGSDCMQRPTALGITCCKAGKATRYFGPKTKSELDRGVNMPESCICLDAAGKDDVTKEFDMASLSCVAKGSANQTKKPCACDTYIKLVTSANACAKNAAADAVTKITKMCDDKVNCDGTEGETYIEVITNAIANCNAQPVEPVKPTINEKRLAAAVEAIDKYRSGLDVSVWKDEEGNFNTARLVSDSIAGVVLGTAGGLITSSVVKKNQVKSGFEDIMCTIGGQPVGSYGDEIQVGIQ